MAKIKQITVQTIVNEPIEKVWESFTNPKHIIKWNQASEDWHCPRAQNDLRVGGRFVSRMEAKDGSDGFDFTGVYDAVVLHKKIAYTMDDGREVEVVFEELGNSTAITTIFETEKQNTLEMQRSGWQSVLDSFKNYTEALK